MAECVLFNLDEQRWVYLFPSIVCFL